MQMHRLLTADIGGTNARYALIDRDRGKSGYRVSQARTLASADYDSIEQSLDAYLSGIEGRRPTRACLAVAGPVGGDRIRLTNLRWEFSVSQLARLFGFEDCRMVNDFSAFLAGVSELEPSQLHAIKPGVARPGSIIAAVGPGTGLGIASMTPGKACLCPIESEGGHVTFAPGNELELEIARILMSRFGRVSMEQVLSGPGLVNLYESLCVISGGKPAARTPEQITAMGLSREDPNCEETLRIFCGILGNFAGDVALMTGARGGVYIGGGVVRKFESVLTSGEFVRRFCDKGAMSAYVSEIPVYAVNSELTALLGAAVLLESFEDRDAGAKPTAAVSA
jgi:glucokinase